jgi:hypothetical protein
MPNSDDILKLAGVKIHEDKKLGRFYGPGHWRLNGSVDFPFQEKVSFTFELTQMQQQFPESMARNVEAKRRPVAGSPFVNSESSYEMLRYPS